ncbi:MAG: DNA repair protein RadC [Paludibacteraceae bacterium]|nr:DNA repair protein RadC [Paludibacteraceae bacterium]
MENLPNRLSLKELAIDDRPREKMLQKGAGALSNAELLAILIGSGNNKETAVELSQRILTDNRNNLAELSTKDLPHLMTYRGIGEAKAITIAAAMEIGRRRSMEKALERPSVSTSEEAYNILKTYMEDLDHEEVWVLYLNQANKVISSKKISSGGVALAIMDVKLIMKEACNLLASSIILSHNHPSGAIIPSEHDKKSTQRIKEACNIFEISMLDHIIVGKGSYFSFNDNGLLLLEEKQTKKK